jgi:hypothetical protein
MEGTMQKLTDEQAKQWAIDGYLHIEGALTGDEVAFFSDELDRVRQIPGWEPSSEVLGHYDWLEHAADTDNEGFMDRRDLLPYGQPYIDLIDHPGIFDLIVDIMGPHILLSMTQAIVRASGTDFPGYTHTDGGEALREIRVTESSPPLAMKVMYLLTDVEEGIDNGGLTVFPGSHMRPWPTDRSPRTNPQSRGAAQLGGKAGDCYLFPHAIWHGPAPNQSGTARKTLLYNYCQLFMRFYDFAAIPEVLDQCSPRQRRLLGDLGHTFRPGDYFYVPQDQLEVIDPR